MFPPRRQMEFGAQMLLVLIAEETTGLAASAFDENSAGRADVHRIEVIAVLDVGGVGEAELLVNRLFALRALRGYSQPERRGERFRRRTPQLPAGRSGSCWRIKVLAWPSGARFKTVKLAFLAGLAKTKSLGKETLAFGDLPHGEDGAIESSDGFTARRSDPWSSLPDCRSLLRVLRRPIRPDAGIE